MRTILIIIVTALICIVTALIFFTGCGKGKNSSDTSTSPDWKKRLAEIRVEYEQNREKLRVEWQNLVGEFTRDEGLDATGLRPQVRKLTEELVQAKRDIEKWTAELQQK